MICNACPRKCNIDRENTLGFCRSPERFRLARASLHFWEEPCISGKDGSGTVFFSGCNLRCAYCQNYEISHGCKGKEVSGDKLVEIFESLIRQGANNINLVNPSHYALQLANVLKTWKSPVPIVYNTSGYDSAETIKKLDGLVDVYLTDFKYIRSDKAALYSRAEDYVEVTKSALAEMQRQIPHCEFDGSGIMKKGVIVRHLILPSNTNSSLRIIDYLAENCPESFISLMAQYTPCGELENLPELNRKITAREYNKVVDYAVSKGIDKLFLQELTSADKKFIPVFDFTGIM
ncbi:MAG: radical SAM protein [Ruminococcaceae bacterium]|nr:radical SAM protein [Oscillospiraceae bacterium]